MTRPARRVDVPPIAHQLASTMTARNPEIGWDLARLEARDRRLLRWAVGLRPVPGLGRWSARRLRIFVTPDSGPIRGSAVWAGTSRAGWLAAVGLAPSIGEADDLLPLLQEGARCTFSLGLPAFAVVGSSLPAAGAELPGILHAARLTEVGRTRRWSTDLGGVGPAERSGRVRRARPHDLARIAEGARAARAPWLERLSPLGRTATSRGLVIGFDSTCLDLVGDRGAGPAVWVRSTVSRMATMAHLVIVAAPTAEEVLLTEVLGASLSWSARRGARAAWTEVAEGGLALDGPLARSGFRPGGVNVTYARGPDGTGVAS